MGDARKVSDGLHLMYLGNIIAIIATVCALLVFVLPPLVFLVAVGALVGGIICLVGLARLRNEHPFYMNALIAVVVGMIAGLFANGDGFFGQIMDLVQTVCSVVQVYFVVQATNSFLSAGWFQEQVGMGERAWKWEVISLVIGVASTVLMLLLPLLAIPFVLANLVVSIVALVFYLSYLKASAAALA